MTRLGSGSLRTRVTLVGVVVLSLALIAMVAITSGLFGVASQRAVDSVLRDRTATARQVSKTAATPEAFLRRVDGRSVRVRLRLADGTELGSRVPPADTEVSTTIALTGPREWAQGATATLSVDNRILQGVHTRLVWQMAITAVCALSITVILLWFGVRYALRPLDTMTALARSTARGRRGGRLLPDRSDSELGRTASAFDDMLDSLESAEARERAAQHSVRRFVADAAHELRTPVTGVQAIAETLLQAPPDMSLPDREELLLLLIEETRRAGRLVDDMVDMARIDAGLMLRVEPTDIGAIVDEQVQRARIVHPGIAIDMTGTTPRTMADPVRIAQIVANVIDNACQASPPGGAVRVDCGASVRDTGQRVVTVTIADSGPGVAAADAERIFERLVRLDASRHSRSGGSGLGLAVARGLARSHSGDLELIDSDGPGATFVLSVPLVSPVRADS